VQLTVYSRSGCHLCEEMLDRLAALRPELGYGLTVIDIGNDGALEARFGQRVPVLVAEGKEICHYFLDEPALREYVDGA